MKKVMLTNCILFGEEINQNFTTSLTEQLLDLLVAYGDAFPLKNSKGEEIIPAENQLPKSSLHRYPTDFLPNSLDVTPSMSRQVKYLKKQFFEINILH